MARASPLNRGRRDRTSFGSAGYPARTVEALDLASAIVLTPSLGRSPRDPRRRARRGRRWPSPAPPRSMGGWSKSHCRSWCARSSSRPSRSTAATRRSGSLREREPFPERGDRRQRRRSSAPAAGGDPCPAGSATGPLEATKGATVPSKTTRTAQGPRTWVQRAPGGFKPSDSGSRRSVRGRDPIPLGPRESLGSTAARIPLLVALAPLARLGARLASALAATLRFASRSVDATRRLARRFGVGRGPDHPRSRLGLRGQAPRGPHALGLFSALGPFLRAPHAGSYAADL